MQVTNAVVDHTHILCDSCGLTSNHIADGAFQCFTQGAHEVTFRAHLYATLTKTPQELINYTVDWVKNGASIVINGLLLTVDRTCDVVIESFSEPECTQQPWTTEPVSIDSETNAMNVSILETTTVSTPQTTTLTHETTQLEQPTKTSTLHFSAEVILVGVIVVVVIFIIAVMVTIIIVVCLCTKYCR